MISAVLKSLNDLGYVVWGAACAGQIEMEGQLLGGDGGTRSGKRTKRDVGLWREGGHGELERTNTGREAGRRENGISYPDATSVATGFPKLGFYQRSIALGVFLCVTSLEALSALVTL